MLRGPALLAVLLLPAAALAQEPMTILAQKEWSVGGVCIGPDRCGFCTATDAAADGTTLRVQPPRAVSLVLPEGRSASAAALAVGGEEITLARGDDGGFAASEADGARIIQAMRRTAGLGLRLGEGAASRSYRFDLAAFPRAYAAMLKACPGAGDP
jgi:hypothetical protein